VNHRLNSKNILVVDDEPEILSLFRIFLETEGYHVETALTAKEAMAIINAKKIHLAIMDINLPDSRGTELLEKIQVSRPEIIKIVITGDNISSELQESFDKNAVDAYIVKPVKKKVFIALVKEKIEKSR
jgi:DNA-binding NtrC family response regulator